jgi:hypothetical protein
MENTMEKQIKMLEENTKQISIVLLNISLFSDSNK